MMALRRLSEANDFSRAERRLSQIAQRNAT